MTLLPPRIQAMAREAARRLVPSVRTSACSKSAATADQS
jgi:hypothetical protein